MAIKQLNKTTKPASPTEENISPEALAFIEKGKSARDEPAAPAEESTKKSQRFFVYMDAALLRRIDKECKRRGGIGRSVLLRQLAAEHLPE